MGENQLMPPAEPETVIGETPAKQKPYGPPIYVTHAVLSLDCGGLERVVVDLARHGSMHGQQVSVLCLERPGLLAPQVERLGVRVVCLNKPPGVCWEMRKSALAAMKLLQPDVLHTHQLAALFYIAPAAAKAGTRVVHTEHSNHLARAPGWIRRWRYRLMLGWAGRGSGRFCCVAPDIAREVTRLGVLPRRNVHIVPNGIDTAEDMPATERLLSRAKLGIPTDASVIGTVGRLHPVKQQDLLIRAFAGLRRHLPGAHLVIVGEGPAHRELVELSQALSLSGSVHFTGYSAQPQRFLQIMDVFALTSRWEGMPLAVLEAWAAGLPVVASAVGGIPELVRPGENGLLFRNGNEPELTAALEELLTNRPRACQLGATGRADVADRYSAERMTAAYERHYRELLAG